MNEEKIKDAIKRLDEILDSLDGDDRMEVYGYLTNKMKGHLFGDEVHDKSVGRTGDSPFGKPVGRKSKKTDVKIAPDKFVSHAIYDTAVEDVSRLTLRVEMEDIEPVVWRDVVVPSNLNLESLGHILVDVMGWEGYHLHQFIKGYDYYSIPDEEFGVEDPFDGLFGPSRVKRHDSRDYTVGNILPRKRSWIDYEYDFGDSWMHRVTVVDSRKYGKDEERKVELIAGANACPPEDCGGLWGYDELLEAIKKPRSKRAREYEEWLGYKFDPSKFDLEKYQDLVDDYN